MRAVYWLSYVLEDSDVEQLAQFSTNTEVEDFIRENSLYSYKVISGFVVSSSVVQNSK